MIDLSPDFSKVLIDQFHLILMKGAHSSLYTFAMSLDISGSCLAGAEVQLHGDVFLLHWDMILLESQITLQIDLPLLSSVLCL